MKYTCREELHGFIVGQVSRPRIYHGERRRRPRVNCTSCTSSLSESHYLNASTNGGRVSYKFATQYHFIIAWHPRYELWNEAHVRLCSVSHRAGGYNTSEQKVISTRMMLVQVAAYGIIMRRNTRAAIRLEAYSGILNYSANNKDNRDANSVSVQECLQYIIINHEITGAF